MSSTREARCRPELSAVVNNDTAKNMHNRYNFTIDVYAISYPAEYVVTLARFSVTFIYVMYDKSFADMLRMPIPNTRIDDFEHYLNLEFLVFDTFVFEFRFQVPFKNEYRSEC